MAQVRCVPVKNAKKFPFDKEDELDFCIVRYRVVTTDDIPKEVTGTFVAVGVMLPYSEGAAVTLTGEWKQSKDEKHGDALQFEVSDWNVEIPTDRTSVTSYLATMDNCDAKIAARIYNEYGDDTMSVLDTDPYAASALFQRKENGEAFAESYMLKRFCSKAYRYLRTKKVSTFAAKKVAVKALIPEAIKRDPFNYTVTSELPYSVAQKIAKEEGVSVISPQAIKAAIIEVLRQNEGSSSSFSDKAGGNTYIERKELMKRTANMVGLFDDDNRLYTEFSNLVIRGLISLDNGCVFRKTTHDAERTIAREAVRLMSASIEQIDYAQEIDDLNDAKKMRVAPEQRRAIKVCLNSPFSLLIGGPGCGKTTIEQFIIELFRRHHPEKKVLLLAPTGKAARRMSESTGEEACTVHHGLGVTAGSEVLVTDTKLDAGLILVDEASMLDSQVSAALLKAVQTGTQLVLIGDTDQLPSVGTGNVLFELIRSGVVPIGRLTVVYRQKAGSIIAVNCAKIRRGAKDLEYADGVFEFIPAKDDDAAADLAVQQFMKGINSGLKIDDICLLSPYRRNTETGINKLNTRLQKLLNPHTDDDAIVYGEKKFLLGDKVMCMTNMAGEVANGDTGFITEIKNKKSFTVDYGDGRVIMYPKSKMRDFELAYGISIHKSQGQEFKLCIIMTCNTHDRMLKRNLLYTAISRAKEKVVLIGQESAINKCIDSEDVTIRKSMLGEHLRSIAK